LFVRWNEERSKQAYLPFKGQIRLSYIGFMQTYAELPFPKTGDIAQFIHIENIDAPVSQLNQFLALEVSQDGANRFSICPEMIRKRQIGRAHV
jgi:hypothetical protein